MFRKDKISIFWDIRVMSCGPLEVNSACCLLHAVFLLGFPFDPEDEADIYLQNSLDIQRATRHYNQEVRALHNHRREHLRLYAESYFWCQNFSLASGESID